MDTLSSIVEGDAAAELAQAPLVLDWKCVGCRYEATHQAERCPMCGSEEWDPVLHWRGPHGNSPL